ncbi:hypothetical protein [Nocardioides sp. TF02-7]|uniref:hypothetical protein n=1 Tax=Nocardioides sp. TF02-7 TaxID=2917724 RepID=UPI001F0566D8|nr:hypothetical protein [Nocardioides sp. TF02-7]UMG93660.1 hypothetical protein MF408_05605 [Nocardioides sp. TF02-7]
MVVVLLVALGLSRAADDGSDAAPEPSASSESSESSAPAATVPDEEWCATWRATVQVQAQYVATQSADDAATLLTLVERLRSMGYPESLAEAGRTELTAVLDDLRASADPSFTPSVVPSEPADVPAGGHAADDGHDHAGADEAPFGFFLAEHCPA